MHAMSSAKVNLFIAAFLCTLYIAIRPVADGVIDGKKNPMSSSGGISPLSPFQPNVVSIIKDHIVKCAPDPSSIELIECTQPKRIMLTAPWKGSPVPTGHYTVVSVRWRYRNIFNGMSVQEKYFILNGSKISYELDRHPDMASLDSLIKNEIDKTLVNAK
jgi:hypothetical protein